MGGNLDLWKESNGKHWNTMNQYLHPNMYHFPMTFLDDGQVVKLSPEVEKLTCKEFVAFES